MIPFSIVKVLSEMSTALARKKTTTELTLVHSQLVNDVDAFVDNFRRLPGVCCTAVSEEQKRSDEKTIKRIGREASIKSSYITCNSNRTSD